MRGVFGDVDAIVEISGWEEDLEREPFGFSKTASVEDNALDMLAVVSGISFFLGGEKSAEKNGPVCSI